MGWNCFSAKREIVFIAMGLLCLPTISSTILGWRGGGRTNSKVYLKLHDTLPIRENSKLLPCEMQVCGKVLCMTEDLRHSKKLLPIIIPVFNTPLPSIHSCIKTGKIFSWV